MGVIKFNISWVQLPDYYQNIYVSHQTPFATTGSDCFMLHAPSNSLDSIAFHFTESSCEQDSTCKQQPGFSFPGPPFQNQVSSESLLAFKIYFIYSPPKSQKYTIHKLTNSSPITNCCNVEIFGPFFL